MAPLEKDCSLAPDFLWALDAAAFAFDFRAPPFVGRAAVFFWGFCFACFFCFFCFFCGFFRGAFLRGEAAVFFFPLAAGFLGTDFFRTPFFAVEILRFDVFFFAAIDSSRGCELAFERIARPTAEGRMARTHSRPEHRSLRGADLTLRFPRTAVLAENSRAVTLRA